MCGDLNANPVNPQDSRDRALASFCGDHGLVTPHNYYHGDSFVHKGGQGRSKIDHFLSITWQDKVIERVHSYPSNTSDHEPITAVAGTNILSSPKEEHAELPEFHRYEWDKIDLCT